MAEEKNGVRLSLKTRGKRPEPHRHDSGRAGKSHDRESSRRHQDLNTRSLPRSVEAIDSYDDQNLSCTAGRTKVDGAVIGKDLTSDAASMGERTISTTSLSSMATRRSAMSSDASQTNMSSDSSQTSKRSTISFGSVSVHTHDITLGDNPAVKTGPPLSLGKLVKSEEFKLDEYEAMSKGRSKKAIRIPDHLREEMLRENGHSADSLLQISREINEIKETRRLSKLELNPMQEYQVMSNVSLRQSRRHAAQESKAERKKDAKKRRDESSFYSRWLRRKSSAS